MRLQYQKNCRTSLHPTEVWHFGTRQKIGREQMETLVEWCTEQFGPPGDRWDHNCFPDTIWRGLNLGFIWITDDLDAVAMRLRWC